MARATRTKGNTPSSAQTECFMLCDYARVENGKLYIVGGGWNDIVLPALPLEYSAYLAIKLVLPGRMLVEANLVRVDLLDESGRELGDPVFETRLQEPPVAAIEEITVQEPSVVVLMGVAVQMALAKPGQFVLRLVVNDALVAETRLAVALAAQP